jgi:ATP-dependent Clp endopeptidase proteolytic subunit ClpP
MGKQIKLYGEIASWNDNSADRFLERFNEAVAESDEIDIHMHSVGGSVFEANLIYNAISSCKKQVNIYVDGLAASMASIIMSAGKKVYMAENAFVMVHAPSAYVNGTADEMEKTAKMLRSMEGCFSRAYSKRTGKTAEELKAWLSGDNWFDAQEALKEKLIDGIVDKVELAPEDPKDKYKDMTLMGAFTAKADIYDNYFINSKKEEKMDKKNLIAKFGLSGVTEQSTDAEVEAAIEAKMNASEKKLKEITANQVKAVIDTAVAAKKISESQRKSLQEFAEVKGVDALGELLNGMTAPQSIVGQIQSAGKGGAGRDGWDWDKWQKEDPRGLEKLEETDNAKFKELFDAKYGN